MKCPTCEGKREWTEYYPDAHVSETYPCGHCEGTGSIGIREWVSCWLWDNIPEEITERYIDWLYERRND